MSTPFIYELLTRMDVRPKPLFQGDVDSADSHVDDDSNGSDRNDPDAEETMPTQAQEASGEVDNLVPSIGVLDPESYVDMREPWIEGAKGEKVSNSGVILGRSLIFCSVFAFKWLSTQTPRLGSSVTEALTRTVAGVVGASVALSRSRARCARSAAIAAFASLSTTSETSTSGRVSVLRPGSQRARLRHRSQGTDRKAWLQPYRLRPL
jgi:hypothetical protein